MSFQVVFRPRGFRNAGAPTEVTPNGASLDGSWLPVLGYQAGRELTDERVRREHGLPPRLRAPTAGFLPSAVWEATRPGRRVRFVYSRSRNGYEKVTALPTTDLRSPSGSTDPDGVAWPLRDRKAERDTATLPLGP